MNDQSKFLNDSLQPLIRHVGGFLRRDKDYGYSSAMLQQACNDLGPLLENLKETRAPGGYRFLVAPKPQNEEPSVFDELRTALKYFSRTGTELRLEEVLDPPRNDLERMVREGAKPPHVHYGHSLADTLRLELDPSRNRETPGFRMVGAAVLTACHRSGSPLRFPTEHSFERDVDDAVFTAMTLGLGLIVRGDRFERDVDNGFAAIRLAKNFHYAVPVRQVWTFGEESKPWWTLTA